MLGRSKLAMKRLALLEPELGDDLFARALVGGGRQRDAGDAREPLGQHLELTVFGPEVVSPLGDAVRLVDGEQRQLRAREQRQGPLLQQPLGRNVEEIEAARGDARFERRLLAIVERRIEERRLDAGLRQRLDLILHQRDQRRDDDAGAGPDEGGDLIAKRLAAARRHQGEHVAAGDHGGDDVRLVRAELPKTEHVGQHLLRAIEGDSRIHDLARRGARHRPQTLSADPRTGVARFERGACSAARFCLAKR